jgi:uncharacterized protein (DUF2164 family)
MIVAVPTVAFAEEAPETEETTTITEEETLEIEEKPTITEMIVDYVKENAEPILAMVASIVSAIMVKFISGKLSNSVSTLNNNAIEIAKNSDDSLKNTTKENKEFIAKMTEVLSKLEKSEEEKKVLEEMLCKTATLLETSKIALVELGNEFAELLLLANIPNAKKESFYSSHKEAMRKLEETEGVINSD